MLKCRARDMIILRDRLVGQITTLIGMEIEKLMCRDLEMKILVHREIIMSCGRLIPNLTIRLRENDQLSISRNLHDKQFLRRSKQLWTSF